MVRTCCTSIGTPHSRTSPDTVRSLPVYTPTRPAARHPVQPDRAVDQIPRPEIPRSRGPGSRDGQIRGRIWTNRLSKTPGSPASCPARSRIWGQILGSRGPNLGVRRGPEGSEEPRDTLTTVWDPERAPAVTPNGSNLGSGGPDFDLLRHQIRRVPGILASEIPGSGVRSGVPGSQSRGPEGVRRGPESSTSRLRTPGIPRGLRRPPRNGSILGPIRGPTLQIRGPTLQIRGPNLQIRGPQSRHR